MADRIDEFLYRGFIPAENRGGIYHVVLEIDGKLIGPMTPKEADARGWPLSSILADINTQALHDLAVAEAHGAEVSAKLDDKTQELDALKAELRSERAARATLESAIRKSVQPSPEPVKE